MSKLINDLKIVLAITGALQSAAGTLTAYADSLGNAGRGISVALAVTGAVQMAIAAALQSLETTSPNTP